MQKKPKTPDYLKFILRFWLVIVALLVVIAAVSAVLDNWPAKKSANANTNLISSRLVTYQKTNTSTQPEITANSPIRGDKKAKITIFEYSNFDCIYSATIQPTLKNILKKYPHDVNLVWKDLPTVDDTENMLPHKAARCAQKQNKFWEYSDLLWQNPLSLSLDTINKYAKQIKLNQKQFESCLKDTSIDSIIKKDVAEADRLLISGTPYFYINGQTFSGVFDEATVEKLINQASATATTTNQKQPIKQK